MHIMLLHQWYCSLLVPGYSQSGFFTSTKRRFVADNDVSYRIRHVHQLPLERSMSMDVGTQWHMVAHGNDETDALYPAGQVQRSALQRAFISIAIAMITVFTPLSHGHLHLPISQPPPTYADEIPTPPTGMTCVTKYCSRQLSQCLSDLTCAKGLGCFVNCAVNDALVSNKGGSRKGVTMMKSEGTCQVRCMDLFQNELLDDFTDCSLTKHHCYDALKADDRYPPLPFDLWDDRLKNDVELTQSILKELFSGTWYISAGLNPAFDIFDCQTHRFYPPTSQHISLRESHHANKDGMVADATFSYRIKMHGGKDFTKNGQKRLVLLRNGAGRMYHQTPLIRNDVIFQPGKKWGIDHFHVDRRSNYYQKQNFQRKYRLALILRPPSLDYEDDWTILSFSNDPKNGYIVLAYQGTNSAWSGYGGLNIYTRTPINFVSMMRSIDDNILPWDKEKEYQLMLKDIQGALGKVGLSLNDLLHVDNSCKK